MVVSMKWSSNLETRIPSVCYQYGANILYDKGVFASSGFSIGGCQIRTLDSCLGSNRCAHPMWKDKEVWKYGGKKNERFPPPPPSSRVSCYWRRDVLQHASG
jgi:hypothetical protein